MDFLHLAGAWKPVIAALLLPPVPWMLLILIGARLILPRRGLGFFILLTGWVLLWLSCCTGVATWLQNRVLRPPPAIWGSTQDRLTRLGRDYAGQQPAMKRHGQDALNKVPPAGIVVLGGGVVPRAPEYGVADLATPSADRLRYGVWLSRQTGLPLGFSGGVGWAQKGVQVASEAETAARISEEQFGVRLTWVESRSADTRENAMATVSMLADQGVHEIVIVTQAWHMPRAQRAFESAAAVWAGRTGKPAPVITPAPMGFWGRDGRAVLDWLPSHSGMMNVRLASHELLGMLSGN